jgi:uncharacterized membrane protein YebE (DUF533 family)
MDPGILVHGVLRSVLGGRGKRSKRALRYLTRGHSSLWSNPATLLTAAGVAWGIYETLKKPTSLGADAPPAAEAADGPDNPAAAEPVPPLPNGAGSQSAAVGDDALRIVRLAISAANADGAINERERAAILQQATAAGVAGIVEHELQYRRPLAEIVAGVSDPTRRATLYVLAFTILRADEQLTGAERIYLAQLANLMGLDPKTVRQLETDAGERIEAVGD